MIETKIHTIQMSREEGNRIGRCLMTVAFICCSMYVSAQTTYFRTVSGIPYIPVLSSAPSSPATGSMYINSGDGFTYCYNGSVWIPLAGSPGLITSPSGRVWMDRNVGAYRAATSSTDYLAYGSLFQWCRGADGHQLVVWTSSTAGTPVNGTTGTLSTTTNPGHSLFITSGSGVYDWLSTQQSDGSLWWNGTVAGVNNPCPGGFHVPTYAELNAEYSAGITNAATAYSRLKLTVAGFRSVSDGSLTNAGATGAYWSSSVYSSSASSLYFGSNAFMGSGYRSNGFSVRCIKD